MSAWIGTFTPMILVNTAHTVVQDALTALTTMEPMDNLHTTVLSSLVSNATILKTTS